MKTGENLDGVKGNYGVTVDDLFAAGAHFGFSKSRRNSSVKNYIFGTKNRMDVIDLEKTLATFDRAMTFIEQISKEGKQVLLVGNKKEARSYVVEAAEKMDMPYVAERWIGGTLTNFGEIRKRIARLEDLLAKKESGELNIYTKKERTLLDKETSDLLRHFGGIVRMKRLPAAIFVIDSGKEKIAVAEAKRLQIPVVGLSGSDCAISEISYPIIGNDSSVTSIKYFVDKLVSVWRDAKSLNPSTTNISLAPAVSVK
ncbi:MAG: 30S ribosomal protein S2 [Candidatus Vogelbacteria bacterium]|nr:30S ribosomal protein S2 [Candidatus Vogelbacteria bacterium]